MNRFEELVARNAQGIRRVALSLLEKHNGGIGVGQDEQFSPCECPDCERARKWLHVASTSQTTADGQS